MMYPKIYTYTEGHHHEETRSATQALQWHREGKRITVWGVNPDETQYHVSIRGAARHERNAAEENRDHCKHIAKEVEEYSNGNVYRCPECGEEIRMPDDVGDKYRCPHCHTVDDVDNYEQCSIWDYMEDILDIDFVVSRDREYRSCEICVAWGGPNIYIDTASSYVKLYWWTEYAEYPLSYAARDAIDEWAEEYWNL